MKHCLFDYEMLFGDHMNKCSDQARLYFVKLMFYANVGFVSNPMSILDSMGYDKGVFNELVNNGEILCLPDRSEIFITSYFVHNKFKHTSWLKSPFSIYWKNKLFIKSNGVATFTPQNDVENDGNIARQMFPEDYDKDGNLKINQDNDCTENDAEYQKILDDFDNL